MPIQNRSKGRQILYLMLALASLAAIVSVLALWQL